MSFKLWITRLAFRGWVCTGGYALWSKIVRSIRGGPRRPLTRYTEVSQLEDTLASLKWTEDPLKGRLDYFAHPEEVEYEIQHGVLGTRSDCDEFALYAATVLQDMKRRELFKDRVYVMTVSWLRPDGRFAGHNVALTFDISEGVWGHIGNWHGGKWQKRFKSVEDTAASIYGLGTLIGWCVHDVYLRPVMWGFE